MTKEEKQAASLLAPGTLWPRVLERTEQALASGALLPIATESTFIHDQGVDFLVRKVSSLERKAAAKGGASAEKANPFLPYEPEMFVADITDTHLCLLNKFNVIEHHLLIVTRAFEDQRHLLTPADFEALYLCLAEFEGLAFYNGGVAAGASQPHKHLQLIPLPMAESGPPVPIEPLLAAARFAGEIGTVPGLPFVHAYVKLDAASAADPAAAAPAAYGHYRAMLEAAGMNKAAEPDTAIQSGPYNLLLTREWRLLVPRSKEFFKAISVNALGFAGALLAWNEEQMQQLKAQGGMAVLKHTGFELAGSLSEKRS